MSKVCDRCPADPRLSRLFLLAYFAAGGVIIGNGTRFLSSKGWHQVVEQTPGGQMVLGGALLICGVIALLTLDGHGPAWLRGVPYIGGGAWCLLVGLSFLLATIRDPTGGTPGLIWYPLFGLVMIYHGLDHVYPPPRRCRER